LIRGNDRWCTCETERDKQFFEVVGIFADGKVDEVDRVERERHTARNKHDGDDLLTQSKRLSVFLFDPLRFDGVGSEDNDDELAGSNGIRNRAHPIVAALQISDIPPDIIASAFEVASEFAGEVNIFA